MNSKHKIILRFFFLVLILFSFSRVCYSEGAQPGTEKPQETRLITIPEGIRILMKDSHLLKASFADDDMALAQTLMARSALLPQVSASIVESFLRYQPGAKIGGVTAPTAEKRSLSYGFAVYQTLFDFGKSLSNYRATQELFGAQKAKTESVRKLAILEFIIGYFDILESEKMIAVSQKELESLNSYLYDIEHMYQEGAAVKNDLLPAKVRLADAKQKLIANRNLRENLAARLNNMLSLPLLNKISVQDVEMEVPSVPDLDKARETASQHRPEITILSDQIKASVLTQKANNANNYPVVYAQGGYTYAQNKYQTHQDNMNFNLGASIDLFDGGLTKAEVNKERAHQMSLSEQKAKLTDDINYEIESSYIGFKDAQEKVLVAEDALKQAEENVRVTRVKYTEGIATTTDVLEAIALQTSAQTNYYTAEYELKRNYTKLMYSMGIDLALIYDTMERNGYKPQK